MEWRWPDDVRARIEVLGPWRLTIDHRALRVDDLGGARTATALARLAWTTGDPVDRDELAEAVWGDERPATWPSSLRNMLAAARRGLGELPGVRLRSTRAGVVLEIEGGATSDLALISVEHDRADLLRRDGDLAGALDTVREALTASAAEVARDLGGPWLDDLRREVAERRSRLSRLGAEVALRIGDTATAVELARQGLTIHPREEVNHQLLMRALHAGGDRAAALEVYSRLRSLLREEFGTLPSKTTEEVFLDVLRHDEAGDVRDRRRRLPYTSGRLHLLETTQPFVGRTEELDAAVAHLIDGAASAPVLVLSGPAGIGKTRLAAAVAARADEQGLLVLHGRADARVPAPYATVAEAIDGHLGLLDRPELIDLAGNHAAVLSRYLPSCRTLAPSAEATGSPRLERLHAETALVDLLGRIAEAGPTLLVLDDLQWASLTSLRLLEALAEGPGVPGLAVLAIQRDDAPLLPDATGERVLRCDLGPLDREGVAGLLDALRPLTSIAPEESAAVLDGLWQVAAGHPLLTTTLLRGRANDLLRLAQPSAWGPVAREIVPGLPASTALVMRAFATAPGPVDIATLGRVTGIEESTVEAIGMGAAALGLLAGDGGPDGVLALHPTVAAVVRGDIPEAEQEQLRRLFAAEPPIPGSADDVTPETPRDRAKRDLPPDARHRVRAAPPSMRSSIDRGEYAAAVDTGLAAFQLLERAGDPDVGARWQLQILLGEAWRALGDERAFATLDDVVREARAIGDVVTMAEAALAFTATGTGTDEAHLSDALLALYEEALAALGEDEPALRARLLGHLGTAYGWRQSSERAAAATTEAITLAETLGDPATLISVYTTGRRALAGSGMVDHQEFFEERLLQLTTDYNDPPTRVRTAIWRFESRVQRGEGAELEELLSPDPTALQMVRDTGSRHSLLYSRAALLLLRGDLDAADSAIEEAAAVGRANSSAASIVEAIRLIQLMLLRWEQGRLAEVRTEFADFCTAHDVPEWWGSMAFCDAAIGRDADIARELDLFFSGFDRAGARIAIPHGLAALMATPVRRLGQVERARRLYDVLAPAAGTGGYVGCFSGPIDHALGVLADTLGDQDAARAHFTAGAEFSRRLGAPLWVARCETELG